MAASHLTEYSKYSPLFLSLFLSSFLKSAIPLAQYRLLPSISLAMTPVLPLAILWALIFAGRAAPAVLAPSGTSSLPVKRLLLTRLDVPVVQLHRFRSWVQYAAAAYCHDNTAAEPGHKLTCRVNNCPFVEEADTAVLRTFPKYPRTLHLQYKRP
jgi:hypothetical protein